MFRRAGCCLSAIRPAGFADRTSVIRVFEYLGQGARADELRGRMLALIERENLGAERKTLIRARYLLVTVRVPQRAP